MYDPIEALYDWLSSRGIPRADFEDSLTELDLMLVPVEDPTNLFGVMEDSL
jgi:hypothetical protein